MAIINLTNHERCHLGPGYKHGWTQDFYGPKDRADMHRLIKRGLLEPHGNREHTAAITPLGIQAMAYLESKKAEETAIWEAVSKVVGSLAAVDNISGSMRAEGNYVHYEDGTIEGGTVLTLYNTDGTQTVHTVTGTRSIEGEVTVEVATHEDTRDVAWGPGGFMENDKDAHRRIIVNGICYYISPDTIKSCSGFGGRRWEIEYLADGRRQTSHNLWQGSTIPPKWRDRWPDTARFIPPPPRPSIAEQMGLKPVE